MFAISRSRTWSASCAIAAAQANPAEYIAVPHPLQSRRVLNGLGALGCALLIGYALYAERVLGYPPCPLCIFQRIGIGATGVVFLLAALHNPLGRAAYAYAAMVAVAAIATAGVAGRHLYIQSLPPGTVPSCGAPLDVMLEFSPVFEVVKKVLTASGECGTIDWTLLGLSMPGWVVVAAVGLGIYGVWANARSSSRTFT
jgi:protein dithiol:quinone oxidoreductase